MQVGYLLISCRLLKCGSVKRSAPRCLLGKRLAVGGFAHNRILVDRFVMYIPHLGDIDDLSCPDYFGLAQVLPAQTRLARGILSLRCSQGSAQSAFTTMP